MYEDSLWRTWNCQAVFVAEDGKFNFLVDEAGDEAPGRSSRPRRSGRLEFLVAWVA